MGHTTRQQGRGETTLNCLKTFLGDVTEFCKCVNKCVSSVAHSTQWHTAPVSQLLLSLACSGCQREGSPSISQVTQSVLLRLLVSMLCVSHDNTNQERGEYMTEALNHPISVLWMSLTVTQTTVGQDLALRQWRVLTIHYTCVNTRKVNKTGLYTGGLWLILPTYQEYLSNFFRLRKWPKIPVLPLCPEINTILKSLL